MKASKIKLSSYFNTNKQAIKENWNDEFIRLKHGNVNNFIHSRVERMKELIFDKHYIELDISIADYQNKLNKLLTK